MKYFKIMKTPYTKSKYDPAYNCNRLCWFTNERICIRRFAKPHFRLTFLGRIFIFGPRDLEAEIQWEHEQGIQYVD